MQDSTTESTTIYPPYVHGIRAGTNLARFTPLKHVQTFQRHFSKENVQQAIEYLKQEDGPAPLFVTVDTRGTWSTEKGKLFWQATDGTTGKLQLVPKDELDDLIKRPETAVRYYIALAPPQSDLHWDYTECCAKIC